MSGLLGLSLASTGTLPNTAEAVKFHRKLHKVTKTGLGMGPFISMPLIHSSKDRAEEAISSALDCGIGKPGRLPRPELLSQKPILS